MAKRVLTNILEIWAVPQEHRAEPHRIRTEVVISYFDPEWNNYWGECQGRPTWLPFYGTPFRLKPGQRVALDGIVVPARELFDWDKTQVRILGEGIELKPLPVPNVSRNLQEARNRFVAVEGLITRQTEDLTHIKLGFLSDGISATVYVLKDTNAPSPRFQAGELVGMKCIYAPQFNKDGSLDELVLYVARPADITITGTAKTEPRVSVPVTPGKPAREYALTNVADRVLTNLSEIWSVPPEHRAEPYHIRTEVVVYYFDSDWNAFWGECNGTPAWLPMLDTPFPLKTGQRVAIDGLFVQTRDRFIWDKTRVQILEEGIDLKPVPVRNLNHNPQELQRHLVSVEGLIDRWTEEATHVTIGFVSDGIAATVFVHKDTNSPPPRFQFGDFIRLKGVYAPQFDRDGNVSDFTLWVARPVDIEVIGSLKTDPRFAVPVTPTEGIQEYTPTNAPIHVEGIVRSQEPGKWVTLWDATGQVMVQSAQTQPLRPGDRIEAFGYPYVLGVQQCLRGGLYRLAAPAKRLDSALPGATDRSPLRLAERVRNLGREDAARHPPVLLRAVVTWQHEQTPFVFVQDASAGIRVINPKWDNPETTKLGTIVMVQGVAAEGDFVPVVSNAVLTKVGWHQPDESRLVTLEQALTGVEDGRWIEMRGYVRSVTQVSGLIRMDLSTSSGEFQVWTPAAQTFDYLRGSIVSVRGVCAAISNARHQLTGIQIWAVGPKCIQVQEPAPNDLFAVPLRSAGSLRRFNLQNALNQRVRTSGTVVFHKPGRYLCLQDGADSVFALSQQQDALIPGDRVEVVGFPGNENRRFLLREASYRRISTGEEPIPVALSALHSVNLDVEGLLAKAEGTLLNVMNKNGEARLLILSADSTFEAGLDLTAAEAAKKLQALELGSRLGVSGVYEVRSDEYGKPLSFLLHLRSGNDIRVLQRPPWWTLAHLLWLLLAVLVVSLVALTWGFLISHKNKLLRQAQAELQVANDRLEHRVQERTRELQEQVVAKERARAELAEAQENLVLTSRQAGMAEVATGVLHNVGNVLNSVNVSAGILSERLRRSSLESVAKAAELLRQHQDQLARFLTENPKGKALPGYLEKLGEVLLQDKSEMQGEIKSLVKNIDHIKAIVSMQQSYARIGGVLEEMNPTDLAEDAIQINSAALDRHRIHLIRDYHPVPCVMVDRHKVLQILVNLISNAKHALNDKASDRTVILTIAATSPGRVCLSVRDNGMGIKPENLSRIFSQGFTTRKDGHGFGLHSGANAAKELGGSLSVHSEGIGHGATFTLELSAAIPAAPTPASDPDVRAVRW